MNLTKPMTIAIILIIIGILFFALMFFHPISDIALAIAGSGFILSGFIQLGQARGSEQNKKQFEQIMTSLKEITQSLQKEGESKGKGVVIADVLSSGLKYYAEHMTKPKKEDEND
jgi:hypothetical protein